MPDAHVSAFKFQSTPLIRGETISPLQNKSLSAFQSTPLIRGETLRLMYTILSQRFQSTPLIRGETAGWLVNPCFDTISIHSPHTRGDRFRRQLRRTSSISIHSPHTRGDEEIEFLKTKLDISIHSPHTRGDVSLGSVLHCVCKFQSTPLIRGETGSCNRSILSVKYFNPLPSCEGRRYTLSQFKHDVLFQSTPLMRGETCIGYKIRRKRRYFNPLPSCEGRHVGL